MELANLEDQYIYFLFRTKSNNDRQSAKHFIW